MPYASDQQRKYMHAQHPEIAEKWDAEIRAAKKKPVAKAKREYIPWNPPMDDEQLARAHDRQKVFSLTGSGLGVTGLGLLGASAATKRLNPVRSAKLNRYATNTSVTAGGVGALSGINFARIQGEESRRAREIKKSNYGAGFSKDEQWRKQAPYTISEKAADPERSRERRARTYPFLLGGTGIATGVVTANEARKGKPDLSGLKLDQKILRAKSTRVGAGAAATSALAAGAVYHSKKNNRRSYDSWYPQRERA